MSLELNTGFGMLSIFQSNLLQTVFIDLAINHYCGIMQEHMVANQRHPEKMKRLFHKESVKYTSTWRINCRINNLCRLDTHTITMRKFRLVISLL